MKTPIVSVIMPVYNAERYLALAVESILGQSFNDYEFIIIDDFSIDNSYQILQDYARRDQRIRLFRNGRNQKLPKTLNFGINRALGKYIVRMDADDISLPERLAKQVEFMESHPEIGVCGTWYNVFNDDMGQLLHYEQKPITHEMILIYLNLLENPIGHPTVIIRREVLGNLYYPESLVNNAEDYGLWLMLSQYGVKFANLPVYTLNYRFSSSSLSQTNQKNINLIQIKIISDTLSRFGIKHNRINHYLNAFVLSSNIFTKLYSMLRSVYTLREIERNNHKIQLFSEMELSSFLQSLSFCRKIRRKIRWK